MARATLKPKKTGVRYPDAIAAGSSFRSIVRRHVADRPRQYVSAFLRRVLGPHWKHIGFRHIDQTQLSALAENKVFEPELKLLPLFVSQPGCVFDVGANMGEYTYVLEKAVGPEYVYAIEPVQRLSASLRSLFPKAHVLRMALSDAEGTLTLKTPIINGAPLWTRSTLERFVDVGETASVSEAVPVLPLDMLCEQLGVRNVSLIKIDVEGHEEKVLLGAQRILEMCHPVLLVEIEQRHHREPITEIFAWIQMRGYCGLFFDTQTMTLRSTKDFCTTRHQQLQNLGRADYVNNFIFLNEVTAQPLIETAVQAITKGCL